MASQNDSIQVFVTAAVFVSLTVTTTCFRMYVKARVLKKLRWEDWAMVLATLSLVVMSVAGGCIPIYGNLQSRKELSLDTRIAIGHLHNTVVFVYIPAIAFTKLSILLQMVRMFTPIRGTKSWYAMVAFAMFNMLYYLGNFIAQFITCFPRSNTKNNSLPGMCPQLSKATVTGVVNTLSDFCMLALPIFWITRLHLSPAKKLVACAVFTVGALACAATTIRLVYTFKYTAGGSGNMRTGLQLAICKAGEVAAGIVSGNLTWVPAFVRHLKGHPAQAEGLEKVPPYPDSMPDLVFLEGARDSIA